MEELPDIKQLDTEAKDALIVALWEEVQKLRLQLVKKPKKTAKNSSLPPAKGFKAQIAPVPVGMEPGSSFGVRIAALVTTMRYGHGISYCRMNKMLQEVFGLEISEGVIANLLLRVKEQLQSSVDGIVQRLRSSRLVCSDETSARLNGKNQWEWVFQNDQVCLHVIREMMENHRPQIWVSNLFS